MAKKQQQQKERLFEEKLVPAKGGSGELFDVAYGDDSKPVQCLGMTFPNDEARHAHFTEKLREKLKDPEFRKIEGFPVGDDEDILAMSDPPYYTACPNPFLDALIATGSSDPHQEYSRTPFAVDVSQGKTHPLYKAHSYYTKVPHQAIVPSILHYTLPGDVVLDAFSGSGMTGVATKLCATPDPAFKEEVDALFSNHGWGKPTWGERLLILNDLSPFAAFMAANYISNIDVEAFEVTANEALRQLDVELGWMYRTLHSDQKTPGIIDYTVWSEVYSCPECNSEVVFLEHALEPTTKRVLDSFPCPKCEADLSKKSMQRIYESRYDQGLKAAVSLPKTVPVFIAYSIGKQRYEKKPDKTDIAILSKISELTLPSEVPTNEFPFDDMWEAPRLVQRGIRRIHQLYTPRAAHALAFLWRYANAIADLRLRHFMLFFVDQSIRNMSIMNSYEPLAFSQNARGQKAAYYVPSQHSEVSPRYFCKGKISTLVKAFCRLGQKRARSLVSTGSAAALQLRDACVDYIFTDPPFGDNFAYSELNFMIESWYRVFSNAKPEAVVERSKKNRSSQKGLLEYQRLMEECFAEYHRVLRPGRWMTVVFHNSKNAVWGAIQEALLRAGFVVADVRTLDKQQWSFKQITSVAVKQDLIISAYKPGSAVVERVSVSGGCEAGMWEFVTNHLRQLPVFVSKKGKAETIAERQGYVLFDRMVAFHVQNGVTVPMSSAEFSAALRQRLPERDGMFFLSEQVAEYDQRRLGVQGVEQLELFVSDERSAILWLRRELSECPMTMQDLQPIYMKEAQRVWEKHEQPLELQTILEQNFVADKSGKWQVPDSKNEAHVEQLRHRALMREFQQYLDTKGKLKVVRTEALRAGFKDAWQKKDYTTIAQMAKRVPDAVIQEDQALLMYFDNASLMLGD